jgi:hypothetical protein
MVELEPVPEEDDLMERCITMAAIWSSKGRWTCPRHDPLR